MGLYKDESRFSTIQQDNVPDDIVNQLDDDEAARCITNRHFD
jgi:hypothetical protein